MDFFRLPQIPAKVVPLENGWGEKGNLVVPLNSKVKYPNYIAYRSASFDDRLNFSLIQSPDQFYFYDTLTLLNFDMNEMSKPINRYVKFNISSFHKLMRINVIYSYFGKGPYEMIATGMIKDIDSFLIQADRLTENGVEGAKDIVIKESYMRDA